MFSKITRKATALALTALMSTSAITSTPNAAQAAVGGNAPSSWAQADADKAKTLGLATDELTSGYQTATTRAEFCRAAVNFLHKCELEVDGVTPKLFSDTSDKDIGIAAALGITSGTDAAKNLFSPNNPLTREQAAAMLRNVLNALGKDTTPPPGVLWTDAKDIAEWAQAAADVMYGAKIMGGTSTTELVFSPKTPYTHEQSIATLVNLWEYVEKLPKIIVNGVKLGASTSSVDGVLGVPFKRVPQTETAEWRFYGNAANLTIVCFDNALAKFVYSTSDLENANARKYTDANDKKRAYAVSAGSYSPIREAELNELIVFEITNAFRVQHGLSPLTRSDKLDSAARKHSIDMHTRGFYDHVSPDGKAASDRIGAEGYGWSVCGENIASGYNDGFDVTDGWINSSGHRENILSTEYTEIGIGWSAGTYSTQDFAAPATLAGGISPAVTELVPLRTVGSATGYWDWYAVSFDYDKTARKLTAKNIAGQSKTFSDVSEYIGGAYAESGEGFLYLNGKSELIFVDSHTFAANVLCGGIARIGWVKGGLPIVLTTDGRLCYPNLSPYALSPLMEMSALNGKKFTNLCDSFAFTASEIYDVVYMDRGEFTLLGTLDGGTDNIRIACNNRGYVISNGKSLYFLDVSGYFGKGDDVLQKIGSLSDVKQIFANGSTGPTALVTVGNGDVYFVTPIGITKVDGLKNVIDFYGSFVLTSDKKLWRLNYDNRLELVDAGVDGLYYVDTILVYVKNNALYSAWTKELLLNGLKDFFAGNPNASLGAFVTTISGDSFYLTLGDINVSGSIGLHKLELNSPIADYIQKAWNQERPNGVCERNFDILKTADGQSYAVYIVIGNGTLKTEIRKIVADMS